MIPLDGYAKAKKYVDSHAKLTDKEIVRFKKKYPGPCLTISRQSGIDTNLICKKLVESFRPHYSLEWAYFDKDLIRKVISDHDLSPRIQKYLSEERVSTISQMLNELLGVHPPILELIHKMVNTVLNLAEFGYIILIGRGANVITAHLKNTYHIRLVAPLEDRIHYLQESKDISKEWAKKILLREDASRKDYLFRTFRKDINNPLLYNLTINVAQFTLDELVSSIVEVVRLKYPSNKSKIAARIKASKHLKIYA